MNYAIAIKRLRGASGLKQSEFARLIDKTPGYVSKLEIGDRIPATEVIETICREMHVPYYLFALLASEKEDIHNLPAQETQVMTENLLKILVSANDNRG